MMVYKNGMHSYRNLPIRIAELGTMHRYEMSGHYQVYNVFAG